MSILVTYILFDAHYEKTDSNFNTNRTHIV